MTIVKYDGTQAELDRIVTEKEIEGYALIQVQNITEGNFLGFAKEEDLQVIPNPEPSVELQDTLDRIADLEFEIAKLKQDVKAVEEGQDSLRSLSK